MKKNSYKIGGRGAFTVLPDLVLQSELFTRKAYSISVIIQLSPTIPLDPLFPISPEDPYKRGTLVSARPAGKNIYALVLYVRRVRIKSEDKGEG